MKKIVSNNLFLLSSIMIVGMLAYRIIDEGVRLPMDIVAFGIAGAAMLLMLAILMDDVINAGSNEKRGSVEPTGVHMSNVMKGGIHED